MKDATMDTSAATLSTGDASSDAPASVSAAESAIRWTIKEEDVEWSMDWTSMKSDPSSASNEKTQALPDVQQIFEAGPALALMLANDVLFLNDHWWEETWPAEAKAAISLNVNCSDVFSWGSTDAETLPFSELEALYRMWRRDPIWGAAIWCMKRRNRMPQAPVEKRIRDVGIWDLDGMGLAPNRVPAVDFPDAQATEEKAG